MSCDKLISTLQINQGELTLVTGEFLNTRLNILKVEKTKLYGIESGKVVDSEAVADSIRKLVNRTSEHLGVNLTGVILMIPSFQVKKTNKKVVVTINEQLVTKEDVKQALKEASVVSEPGLVLINTAIKKVYVNNVPVEDSPIGLAGDLLTMELDLLYANREVTYQYVGACEKAGLEILDICLDSYAAGKEMILSRKSTFTNVISLGLFENYSALTLYSKGNLISVEIIDTGYGSWLTEIVNNTKMDYDTAKEFCRYNLSMHNLNSNLAVWVSENDGKQEVVTQGQLNTLVNKKIYHWINEVLDLCSNIINKGEVSFLVYGDCVGVKGLNESMENGLNSKVELYVPNTIGARTSDLVSNLGGFYVYYDQRYIYNQKFSSVDVELYNNVLMQAHLKKDKSITNKFKSLFTEKL